MRDDLRRLYQSLSPVPFQELRGGLEALGGGLEGAASTGISSEHTPLLPEQIAQLELLLETSPQAVCEFFGGTRGVESVSEEQARQMIDELKNALANPELTASGLEGLRRPAPEPPPAGFTFDLYDPLTIEINVARRDFQDSDWKGYALGGGFYGALHHANLLPRDPLRGHAEFESKFTYGLNASPGKDLSIGLFADFANGYYHARYIARRFEQRRYSYLIHLGDVYYGGSRAEVESYLAEPLAPVLPSSEVFLLAGNHEMYSKGIPWLSYIDRKRRDHPGFQRQEGTYFRLLRDGFQIIGIDTEWFGHIRYRNDTLLEWLAECLQQGRAAGRVNVLLSSNEPYVYEKTKTTKLFDDLRSLLDKNLVDLWFWGNTHYAALFERTDKFPFIGSCIGHAGYPYYKTPGGAVSPAPTRFVEDGTRFGDERWNDPRPELGNNGFCELVLKSDGSVELIYIDWRGRERHRSLLRRNAAGVLDFN